MFTNRVCTVLWYVGIFIDCTECKDTLIVADSRYADFLEWSNMIYTYTYVRSGLTILNGILHVHF